MARLLGLLAMLMLLMLLFGLFRLGCGSNCAPFLVACIGLFLWRTLVLLAFLMLNFLFSMSVGLGSGWYWSRQFLDLGEVDGQFRCRLFRLDRTSTFGALAVFWGPCNVYHLPEGFGRFIPCRVLITVDCELPSGTQYGHRLTSRQEVTDIGFLDDLLSLFGYPARSGAALEAGTLRLRYCQVSFCCQETYLELAYWWWESLPVDHSRW